jgi:hypothetical protein
MSDDALLGIVLPVVVLIIGIGIGFGAYSLGHRDGYYKGFEDSKLYNEATGSFPNEYWIEASSGKHYDNIQDILESLEPYSNN